jgi:hypothetical protein
LRRSRRDGPDNASNQPDGKIENQREHDVPITCGCGNFGDGEILGRQTRLGEIGVALAKPRNTPSPRLRGEGRGEGLVRRSEHRQVREIVFPLAERLGRQRAR